MRVENLGEVGDREVSVLISVYNVDDLDGVVDEGVKIIGLEARLIRSIYSKLGDAPCKKVCSICVCLGYLLILAPFASTLCSRFNVSYN